MQTADFLKDYEATLTTKAASTIDAYSRILRQFTAWLAERPGSIATLQPEQLTVTALDTYLGFNPARPENMQRTYVRLF